MKRNNSGLTPPPKLKAPFAWVGGKSKLAAKIASLMPPHAKYIEVFGGALSVFYQKAPSKIEVVNDINGDLINLHRIIQIRPQSLSFYLNSMLKSREIFYGIKDGKLRPRNEIEAAAFYYYLINMSFGAKGANYAMSKRRNFGNIYRDFTVYSKRLKRASIENMSYEKLIKEYDDKDALFYLDPPYVGTESYYKTPKGFSMNDHQNLAAILRNIKGKFILSYNDCEIVREFYAGFRFEEAQINYSLNGAARDKVSAEVIVMNF